MHALGNDIELKGHTRLSIVDVATGHQPILAAGNRKGIIANGEIYNFKSLRATLATKYQFTTQRVLSL